jgi:hypothetical protein
MFSSYIKLPHRNADIGKMTSASRLMNTVFTVSSAFSTSQGDRLFERPLFSPKGFLS